MATAPPLAAVVALGRWFVARGERLKADQLRAYYRARLKGPVPPSTYIAKHWDDAFVTTWLAVAEIAPYAGTIPDGFTSASCSECHSRKTTPFLIFDGGRVIHCIDCGHAWVIRRLEPG